MIAADGERRPIERADREPCKPRKRRQDGVTFCVSQRRALRERRRVFGLRPRLRLFEGALKIPLQIRREFLVEEGGRGHARNCKRRGQVGRERRLTHVQPPRHQDHASERDAPTLEGSGDAHGTRRPVAVAHDEQRRVPGIKARRYTRMNSVTASASPGVW